MSVRLALQVARATRGAQTLARSHLGELRQGFRWVATDIEGTGPWGSPTAVGGRKPRWYESGLFVTQLCTERARTEEIRGASASGEC